MRFRSVIPLIVIAQCASILPSTASAESTPGGEGNRFFESEIRPLLVENCVECHGAEKQKGGLRLDSKTGAHAGGESGPVIVPGIPDSSLLITAVRYTDASLEMPPKTKLSKKSVAALERWIQMGAPWPDSSGKTVTSTEDQDLVITDEDRDYWAFTPLGNVEIPTQPEEEFEAHPIDAFINAKLNENGLIANGRSAPRALIRRLFVDLVGLPPTYQEIQAFEKETSANAYEKLVDRLLASPRFGERWGRHWLDVVRFAQTNGYERDDEKPFSWRYRDYVIDAFNSDKPYDQFIAEQIAGDEMAAVAGTDAIIATGFYRLGVWDDEPDDKRAAEYDGLDDIMRTTGETFLGLTLGCARCHDHMFDPISQRDYYELLAVFHNVRAYDKPRYTLDSPTYAPLASPSELQAFEKEKSARLQRIESELQSLKQHPGSGDDQGKRLKALRGQLDREKGNHGSYEYALAVREHGATPRETNVLIRGNAGRPGAEVNPRLPAIFGNHRMRPKNAEMLQSTGHRSAFAEWVASENNPLTARVMTNRVWQHLFGKGLVTTPNDFGKAGSGVTHPKLLDWLAKRLIDENWSVKQLIRIIVLSETYQRASSVTELGQSLDPGNEYYWRQSLRRMEAEAIRDSMLQVGGNLNLKMGGRGFFPTLQGEVIAGGSRPGRGWDYSPASEQNRRSTYLFIKRTMGVPFMEAFDYANTEGSIGQRPTTTVAPQALTLLNSAFVQQQAIRVAQLSAQSDVDQSIRNLYRLILTREPNPSEHALGKKFLMDQVAQQKALASHLTFSPDVPAAINVEFMSKLPAKHFFRAPAGWKSFKGSWGNEYEAITNVAPSAGPYALSPDLSITHATITGRLRLEPATEFAALILRGDSSNSCLELAIDRKSGQVAIRQLAEGKIESMSSKAFDLTAHEWLAFEVEVGAAVIRASVWEGTQKHSLSFRSTSAPSGSLGVRSWGGGVTFDHLMVQTGGSTIAVHALGSPASPRQRALAELAAVLFNLNEFVYID